MNRHRQRDRLRPKTGISGRQASPVDDFVGCGEKRLRNVDTEGLRGCNIDGEVKSCELLDRKIGRFRPF
jgi:hypothetical protein